MNYVISGKGQSIVLTHGLFGNLDNLKSLAAELEKDYQVIRIDLPDHGLSLHIEQLTFEKITQLIDTVLIQNNIDKAFFVGHSLGGKAALAYALNHPEKCSGVVAADIAPVAYTRRHDHVFEALNHLPLSGNTDRRTALEHLIEQGIDSATAQFLLKNLQRTEDGFQWKMNLKGLYNSYDDLIAWPFSNLTYQGPCLFLRGGDSNYVTAEYRDTILSQFPLASMKTIQGTGHWLHAQKPMVFNRIVKEFIDHNLTKVDS